VLINASQNYKQESGMLSKQDKQDKRKEQNRVAQRAFRLRKSKAKAEKNAEAVITQCEMMGASNQQACEYSYGGLDTSSPIETDPAPNPSSIFTASPSSQEEQQIQIHEQLNNPITRVNGQSNREIQGFLPTDGSPDGWLSGQSYGDMEQNDLSNPYWVDAPQSGSSYGFHGAAHSTNLPVQRRSKDPLLDVMFHAIKSSHRVRQAGIDLEERKVKHSMKVSDHSVKMMRMKLEVMMLSLGDREQHSRC